MPPGSPLPCWAATDEAARGWISTSPVLPTRAHPPAVLHFAGDDGGRDRPLAERIGRLAGGGPPARSRRQVRARPLPLPPRLGEGAQGRGHGEDREATPEGA